MNKEQLISQLKSIGIKKEMDLMVHSSLRNVGPVDGGPDTIIDALLETIGPNGTLMMSTVSGSVTPAQPVFHVDFTPSSVGYLSNVFRKREGVVRSLHPVHSLAAFGPKAEFYTKGHIAVNTPWSPDSPYGKLMRNDCFILSLGVDYASNTCMHALEIEARIPGLHTEETTTIAVIDKDGVLSTINHHWHSAKKGKYPDMEQIMVQGGGLHYGRIGESLSRLTDATLLREILLPVFMETPEFAIKPLTDNTFIWEP